MSTRTVRVMLGLLATGFLATGCSGLNQHIDNAQAASTQAQTALENAKVVIDPVCGRYAQFKDSEWDDRADAGVDELKSLLIKAADGIAADPVLGPIMEPLGDLRNLDLDNPVTRENLTEALNRACSFT